MTDILRHPTLAELHALMLAIEELPASEQHTRLTLKAMDLMRNLDTHFDVAGLPPKVRGFEVLVGIVNGLVAPDFALYVRDGVKDKADAAQLGFQAAIFQIHDRLREWRQGKWNPPELADAWEIPGPWVCDLTGEPCNQTGSSCCQGFMSRTEFQLRCEIGRLRVGIGKFLSRAGKHEGDHELGPGETAGPCAHCTRSYVEAETELAALLSRGEPPTPEAAHGPTSGEETPNLDRFVGVVSGPSDLAESHNPLSRESVLREAAGLICRGCLIGLEHTADGKHIVNDVGTADCTAVRIWEAIRVASPRGEETQNG